VTCAKDARLQSSANHSFRSMSEDAHHTIDMTDDTQQPMAPHRVGHEPQQECDFKPATIGICHVQQAKNDYIMTDESRGCDQHKVAKQLVTFVSQSTCLIHFEPCSSQECKLTA